MSSNAPITLIGNVTADPDISTLTSGTQKASFSVAVPHRFQQNGEWKETTSFANVIAWGWLVEHVERVIVKGARVIVSGRFSQRSYETDDGSKRYVVEIVADRVALDIFGVEDYTKRTSDKAKASVSASDDLDDIF